MLGSKVKQWDFCSCGYLIKWCIFEYEYKSINMRVRVRVRVRVWVRGRVRLRVNFIDSSIFEIEISEIYKLNENLQIYKFKITKIWELEKFDCFNLAGPGPHDAWYNYRSRSGSASLKRKKVASAFSVQAENSTDYFLFHFILFYIMLF